MIFSDKNLSQKLELTEARSNAAFVEARAKISPEIGAEWIEVAGTYAMFDGIKSPLTQTFGLGVFEEITDKELDELEAFFKKQGAQTALLDARLKFAKAQGCQIAIMGALPGSQSQRNAEKNGFRIAYRRTKWQLKER